MSMGSPFKIIVRRYFTLNISFGIFREDSAQNTACLLNTRGYLQLLFLSAFSNQPLTFFSSLLVSVFVLLAVSFAILPDGVVHQSPSSYSSIVG